MRIRWLITCIVALSVASPPALAQRAARLRAIDGDTLAWGPKRIRIIGLDAPEIRGRCPLETALAQAARRRLDALVARGITLRPRGRDRYRRLLAVALDRQGRDVAQVLIAEGLARPYTGRGRREGWC